jgi:hypothetical protein
MLRRVALVRNDVLGGSYRLNHSSDKNRPIFTRSVVRLLVTAKVVLQLPILFIMMMEAISSSETSVLPRATRRNIQEDGIRQD